MKPREMPDLPEERVHDRQARAHQGLAVEAVDQFEGPRAGILQAAIRSEPVAVRVASIAVPPRKLRSDMRIAIATPIAATRRTGNRATATRWAGFLGDLGHQALINPPSRWDADA